MNTSATERKTKKSVSLKSMFTSLKTKRQNNTTKYKATNLILMISFPFFLTALIEMIPMKSVSKFIEFVFAKPSIVLFNVLLVSCIFGGLLLLLKKGWLAVLIEGAGLTTLSVVELFKFNANGNHLILTDFRVATSPKSIANLQRFAYIKITPQLVFFVALLLIYIGFVFWFNPIIKVKAVKRVAMSFATFILIYGFIATPAVANPVYSFFNIDHSKEQNYFNVNQKFSNNNFLAFLTETTTEGLNRDVSKPKNYSQEAMKNMLTTETEDAKSTVKPNVIVIMSESFADFREFKGIDIDPSVYKDFDDIRNEGYAGKNVVPTFASFTVRTEFELNLGLPVKSLNDPNMPQRLFLDREQETIPRYYRDMGYDTSFIHTFSKTFYSRERVYSHFAFDHFYWDDSLTVPKEMYEDTYVSDRSIFNQINKIIKETDKPVFVHTTTMQNHQPYVNEKYPDMTEMEYYQKGIKDMLANLKILIQEIKDSGEPTVVLFTGDHFPCFKGDNNVYDQLGITSDNCNTLYEQNYFIWDNFGLDYSKMPKEPVSTFYLPYLVLDLIGAPKSEMVKTMMNKMQTTPVYSTDYDINIKNDPELDSITYDIVLGEQYLVDKEDLNEKKNK